MLYYIYRTKSYEKSLESFRHLKSFNLEKLESMIITLASGEKLPINFRDHALSGSMSEFRECHVYPDVLLIYKRNKERLLLSLIKLTTHGRL